MNKKYLGLVFALLWTASGWAQESPSSVDNLRAALRKALPNKGVSVKVENDSMSIGFKASSNLTDRLTKRAVRWDIVKLLKVVSESDVPYASATIGATYTLVDKFGNEKDEFVVVAVYKKATVKKIN